MSHCSQQDWDAMVTQWRDQKHGVKPTAPEPVKEATVRPAGWPSWINVTERDYTEDSSDPDNGCYGHRCRVCDKEFHGNKRRPNMCKLCASTPPQAQGTPRTDSLSLTRDDIWVHYTDDDKFIIAKAGEQLERELVAKQGEIEFLSTDDPGAKRLLELRAAHAATIAQLEAVTKERDDAKINHEHDQQHSREKLDEVVSEKRDVVELRRLLDDRNGLIHQVRSMLRVAGFPERIKMGEDLYGNEDFWPVKVECQLTNALNQLAAARKDSERLEWAVDHTAEFEKIIDEIKWTPDKTKNESIWRAKLDAAIGVTVPASSV